MKQKQDNIISIKVSDELLHQLEDKSSKLNMSKSAFIKHCIDLYLETTDTLLKL
ncbi:ribbon-helix-helix protein, CopG family [Carboxylicivirga sp. RSCT41]|uniref:ribbon-helix-helix protein, CopG family n=1 Tax=Carboxylicivirga agarovorans TaxID=3417570 RepID=UPI003D32EC0B